MLMPSLCPQTFWFNWARVARRPRNASHTLRTAPGTGCASSRATLPYCNNGTTRANSDPADILGTPIMCHALCWESLRLCIKPSREIGASTHLKDKKLSCEIRVSVWSLWSVASCFQNAPQIEWFKEISMLTANIGKDGFTRPEMGERGEEVKSPGGSSHPH